jgi:two-component system NtrC family sensor kinase
MRPAQARILPMSEFLADVALLVRQHVAAKSGEVTVQCTIEPPRAAVLADQEQLVQIFLNLAINACEAMAYRGQMQISAVATGDWCVVEVADDGPGLDPEVQSQLFTPFVTTKTNGTGLGLPMVARIIHGHGGTVEAANRPQGGAVFTLRLPLAPETSVAAPTPALQSN